MEDTREITLFIALAVLAILFFVILIAFIMVWSKRKLLEKENKLQEIDKQWKIELIKAIVQAEEVQKRKIASDLHDQIIPSLTLTALNLTTQIGEIEKGGKDFSGIKREIETFASLSENVRDIAHDIIPKMFNSFGLFKSIEIAVKQINKTNNSKAVFKNDDLFSKAVFKNDTLFNGELPFPIYSQLTIYRICLELLNNILKHTQYTYLVVTLEELTNFFTVVFAHDGVGITNQQIKDLTESSKGIGLKSMQSRILSLNAKIDYTIDKGASFITLTVPINNDINN